MNMKDTDKQPRFVCVDNIVVCCSVHSHKGQKFRFPEGLMHRQHRQTRDTPKHKKGGGTRKQRVFQT